MLTIIINYFRLYVQFLKMKLIIAGIKFTITPQFSELLDILEKLLKNLDYKQIIQL